MDKHNSNFVISQMDGKVMKTCITMMTGMVVEMKKNTTMDMAMNMTVDMTVDMEKTVYITMTTENSISCRVAHTMLPRRVASRTDLPWVSHL